MGLRGAVMGLSLAVAVLMLVGKLLAFEITGSAAILADAAESVVHLVATSFAAFGLWYASRPADEDHPYGHGRIAFLSAGFEGALVFVAALAVMGSGVYDLWRGPDLIRPGIGLVISGSLATVNLLLGSALVAVGKSRRSLVLVANGKHVLADVLTTGAAIVGLALVLLTGWEPFDPIVAILIGLVIMVSGFSMVRASLGGLMDELPTELKSRIDRSLNTAVTDGVIKGFHAVRARRIDNELWLEMHLLVPGGTSVTVAHRAATEVESRLRKAMHEYRLHPSSHIEPFERDQRHDTANI